MDVMRQSREFLADYVKRIMAEKGLSHRRVAALSGGTISHSTVADIASSQRFNPNVETIVGLAKGLGVSPDEVFRVARGMGIEARTRFEDYAERFDAPEFSYTEWQTIESQFNDIVKTWQRHETQRKGMTKVVAHIGPGIDRSLISHSPISKRTKKRSRPYRKNTAAFARSPMLIKICVGSGGSLTSRSSKAGSQRIRLLAAKV